MLNNWEPAFKQARTFLLAKQLAFSVFTCLGKHTITGLLSASGKQFEDWTKHYRLFSQDRIDLDQLYAPIIEKVVDQQPDQSFVVAHMDDTILRKTGKKVNGTAWRRDPLGPSFHTNFIWGQRFIQVSLALPDVVGSGAARSIPVNFHHCPTPVKPKKDASQEQREQYKEVKKQSRLSLQGCDCLVKLRGQLDRQGGKGHQLVVSVDGSYTNETVLKSVPERTVIIGRIRKDAKLSALPESSAGKPGRNQCYGEDLPTPEQIRQSEEYPWLEVEAFAAGKKHTFQIKQLTHIRWRKAGGKQNLQLVVIRPLSYRLTKNSRLLYRQPAYLICTDPDMSLDQLLQAYLWRWQIEVNFREQKSILGCGQAQVRHKEAVEKVPAFITAGYSLLQLAAHITEKEKGLTTMPPEKWYPDKRKKRKTTGDVINLFRAQIWARSAEINFDHFVNNKNKSRSAFNAANLSSHPEFFIRK